LQPLVDLARGKGREYVIYSPDLGSVARSVQLANLLGVKVGVKPKMRLPTGESIIVTPDAEFVQKVILQHPDVKFIFDENELKGMHACIREDEVATGGTANQTAQNLIKKGVKEVDFCATHTVCTPSWKRKFFEAEPFSHVFVGDTIPRDYRKTTGGKITGISMSFEIAQQLIQVMANIK